MIIKLRNFGPIKEFDFDLSKNLMAIFGKNNLGKSYAISAVYLIMKHLLSDTGDVRGFFRKREKIPFLKNSMQNRKTNDKTEEITFLLKDLFQPTIIRGIERSFIATYSELSEIKNKLSQEPVKIYLHTDILYMVLNIEEDNLNIESLELNKRIVLKPAKRNLWYRETEDTVTLYLSNDENFFLENINDLISRLETSFLIEISRSASYIYYLPASRSGLYQALNAFSQIFAELSKSRSFFSSEVKIPSIAEPISDYFLKLSGIERKSEKKSQRREVLQIVEEMENMLGGEIVFNHNTKQILYKPYQSDLVLDIALTSSMVSELAPVIAYLKYIIAHDHEFYSKSGGKIDGNETLIFIEEPEAHLHPEIQVKLMEIFVKLTKVGVKVVMTSHSDYMFDKMNNLFLDKTLDTSVAQAIVFKETEKGSVAINIPTDELGMDDENFLETAEQLFGEKTALIEKLNEGE